MGVLHDLGWSLLCTFCFQFSDKEIFLTSKFRLIWGRGGAFLLSVFKQANLPDQKNIRIAQSTIIMALLTLNGTSHHFMESSSGVASAV